MRPFTTGIAITYRWNDFPGTEACPASFTAEIAEEVCEAWWRFMLLKLTAKTQPKGRRENRDEVADLIRTS